MRYSGQSCIKELRSAKNEYACRWTKMFCSTSAEISFSVKQWQIAATNNLFRY